jgi:hypothetical protein
MLEAIFKTDALAYDIKTERHLPGCFITSSGLSPEQKTIQ